MKPILVLGAETDEEKKAREIRTAERIREKREQRKEQARLEYQSTLDHISTDALRLATQHCEIQTAANYLYIPLMFKSPALTNAQIEKSAIANTIHKVKRFSSELHGRARKERDTMDYFNQHPDEVKGNAEKVEYRTSELLATTIHNVAQYASETTAALEELRMKVDCPDFND
jgi:hypothetical protein